MILYKVNYTQHNNKHSVLINISTKCGNCNRLEEYGYKGLCVNNCQFTANDSFKKLIEQKVGEGIILEDMVEIPLEDKTQVIILF